MTLPRRFPTMAEFAAVFPERAERIRSSDRERFQFRDTYVPVSQLSPEELEKVREYTKLKQRRLKAALITRDRARYMWLGVRSEAKRKGVEFDLTVEWFRERLHAGTCEMSGVPFNFDDRKRNDPSIDRKAAGGHYTATNCRMILFCLNQAMSNYGEDYIVGVFRQVIERRGG